MKIIEKIKNHTAVLLIIGSALALNAALWALTWTQFPHDQPAAILHYSIDSGIDFIGEGSRIIIVPLTGLIIISMNTVLGLAVATSDKRASWLMWSSLPLAQVLLLIAFYFIWQVNV